MEIRFSIRHRLCCPFFSTHENALRVIFLQVSKRYPHSPKRLLRGLGIILKNKFNNRYHRFIMGIQNIWTLSVDFDKNLKMYMHTSGDIFSEKDKNCESNLMCKSLKWITGNMELIGLKGFCEERRYIFSISKSLSISMISGMLKYVSCVLQVNRYTNAWMTDKQT